jgi:hypothetical protein
MQPIRFAVDSCRLPLLRLQHSLLFPGWPVLLVSRRQCQLLQHLHCWLHSLAGPCRQIFTILLEFPMSVQDQELLVLGVL